jgi:hypothetical protein
VFGRGAIAHFVCCLRDGFGVTVLVWVLSMDSARIVG